VRFTVGFVKKAGVQNYYPRRQIATRSLGPGVQRGALTHKHKLVTPANMYTKRAHTRRSFTNGIGVCVCLRASVGNRRSGCARQKA